MRWGSPDIFRARAHRHQHRSVGEPPPGVGDPPRLALGTSSPYYYHCHLTRPYLVWSHRPALCRPHLVLSGSQGHRGSGPRRPPNVCLPAAGDPPVGPPGRLVARRGTDAQPWARGGGRDENSPQHIPVAGRLPRPGVTGSKVQCVVCACTCE